MCPYSHTWPVDGYDKCCAQFFDSENEGALLAPEQPVRHCPNDDWIPCSTFNPKRQCSLENEFSKHLLENYFLLKTLVLPTEYHTCQLSHGFGTTDGCCAMPIRANNTGAHPACDGTYVNGQVVPGACIFIRTRLQHEHNCDTTSRCLLSDGTFGAD